MRLPMGIKCREYTKLIKNIRSETQKDRSLKRSEIMSKKILSLFLVVIVLVFDAPTAFAATETANFEGLGYINGYQIAETVPINGFRFSTSTYEGVDYCLGYGAGGSAGIIAHYTSTSVAWIKFRLENNDDFALTSIYYDNTQYGNDFANKCEIQGYNDDTQILTMSDVSLAGTGTITFSGWDQVDTVRIVATGGSTLDIAVVFDDIVYEIVAASSVPYMDINQPLALREGETVPITSSLLRAADNDSVVSALQYTVTTTPAHGQLENTNNPGTAITTFTQELIDNGEICYAHDHSDTTSDSFVFKVSDGSNELTNRTFQITVTPVFDPPLPEDAETATFDDLTYGNADTIPCTMPADGFLFITPNNNGMLYYHNGGQDNTPALSAFGTAPTLTIKRNDAAEFKLYSIYLDQNGYGSDTYKIEGYLNGSKVAGYDKDVNVSSKITVTFDDWTENVDEVHITATTGTTPDIAGYIDNIVYIPGTVSPVPYVTVNLPVTLAEGGTLSILSSVLRAADNDSEASALQYTINSGPAHGRLENADDPGVAITEFTQGDIDNGKIRYVHDHSDTLSDSFVFKVSDGAYELTGQTFHITVTPVYDDPIPVGATVATFDNLGGTYVNGDVISAGTPVDGFLFSASDGSGMKYNTWAGQDKTACMEPFINSVIENLAIARSSGVDFRLYSIYLDDQAGYGSGTYRLEGYLNGSKVAAYDKDVDVSSPITVTFDDWTGNVDEVHITAITGTTPDVAGYIDNIVYRDANVIPADITLSTAAVAENAASGAVIGTFSTTDANAGDTFTYSLVSGTGDTDNTSFAIVDNALRSAEVFDYETKSSYSIRIRTTDAAGAAYEEVFAVAVTDVYETLAVTTNSTLSLLEDALPTTIGSDKLETTVNDGLTATYTLTAEPAKGTLKNDGAEINTNDTFIQASIDAGLITYTPDAGENGTDSFTFSVSDGTNAITGTFNIDIAETAPTITNITSAKADGTYSIGEEIDISVAFTKAVTVTGTPQLTLETGATDRTVNYTVGTGTSVLTFTYTPQAGDESADLNYVSSSALTLNGGTIKTESGTDVVLTLPAPESPGSLGANKAIKVQAFPTVSLSVDSENITEDGGNSNITATLSQISSQDVVVTLSYSGTATSGTDYNTPSTTITIPAGSLFIDAAVGVATIQDSDAEGNETIIIDIDGVSKGFEDGTQKQTITILDDGISVVTSVSSLTANGSYKAGDTVSIQVSFSEAVTVAGTPTISLNSGSTAVYQSGSGTNKLTFAYMVQTGDISADLDYAGTSALSLAGGSIQNSGLDASLVLPTPGAAGSLGANKNIVIDTTTPSAPSTPDLAASSDYGVSDNDDITNDMTPTFTGTAETNSTVALYSSATRIGAATADESGNWSSTSAILTSGSHTITATATDGAGNVSAASAALSITIDTTVPTGEVSVGDNALAAGETCEVTFTFTEAITGFTNDDLTIPNGTLTSVGSADGGVTYTAIFTAGSINDDTNTIAVDLTGITDIAGNAGSGTATSANYAIVIPTAPGTPTGVTATAGNGQATISFTPPVSDGGAAIISYTVTSNPEGITATGSASPVTISGLTNGTSYTFTVTATNIAGTGSASPASNSVTPAALTYMASISPASKTFTAATAGYGQQTSHEFTITNTGTCTITGLSASLGGTDFEISSALSANSLSSSSTAAVSVRPKTGLAANTYTDTLTITGNNGVSLTANLSFTVNAAIPTVTSVTVAPQTVSVQKGSTQTFTATVNGTNSPAQTVIWSVYDNASLNTAINASGILTVAVDETAATLTVTATSTAREMRSAS